MTSTDDPGPDYGVPKPRTIRVSDELWADALEAVRWRGDPSVSHILRGALASYVRATEKRRQLADQAGVALNRGANRAGTRAVGRPPTNGGCRPPA